MPSMLAPGRAATNDTLAFISSTAFTTTKHNTPCNHGKHPESKTNTAPYSTIVEAGTTTKLANRK